MVSHRAEALEKSQCLHVPIHVFACRMDLCVAVNMYDSACNVRDVAYCTARSSEAV